MNVKNQYCNTCNLPVIVKPVEAGKNSDGQDVYEIEFKCVKRTSMNKYLGFFGLIKKHKYEKTLLRYTIEELNEIFNGDDEN